MIKEITIPQELKNQVQKANLERDSRRDILLYIMQNNIDIPKQRMVEYQEEYDKKFLEFDKMKKIIEKEYVMPATDGKAFNWFLDYQTNIVSITLPDE